MPGISSMKTLGCRDINDNGCTKLPREEIGLFFIMPVPSKRIRGAIYERKYPAKIVSDIKKLFCPGGNAKPVHSDRE